MEAPGLRDDFVYASGLSAVGSKGHFDLQVLIEEEENYEALEPLVDAGLVRVPDCTCCSERAAKG